MISIETLEIVGGMFIMLCVAFYVGRCVGYRQHADDAIGKPNPVFDDSDREFYE